MVVPIGSLWSVPWPAIPLFPGDGQFLSERLPLIVSPSLSLAVRRRKLKNDSETIAWWRSDRVNEHQIKAFQSQPSVVEISDPDLAREAFLNSPYKMVVLLGHGRLAPGLLHYLDLDNGIAITPADMLQASPPQRLAMITCWGAAVPDSGISDPVTIATLALVRGTEEVLSTNSELLDDAPSSMFVNNVLHRAISKSFARSLHEATLQFLSRKKYREGPLARWAPLVSLGGKE